MSETGAITEVPLTMSKAILPEPTRIIYGSDTIPGAIQGISNKVKRTKEFYLEGAEPKIKTTKEEEQSK